MVALDRSAGGLPAETPLRLRWQSYRLMLTRTDYVEWEARMPETMLDGLMMDDYPLSLTRVVRASGAPQRPAQSRLPAARWPDPPHHAGRVRPPCSAAGTALAAWARRGRPHRHADVEPARAPRGVLRDPADGRRDPHAQPPPAPDELSFIAHDADDAAIIVDETLLGALNGFRDGQEFEHVIVSPSPAPVPRVHSTTSR